ncbi:uncharacterized protein N7483_009143 [Penicillium malachiteum]|uniref:uncharacterized protein n=1 Tax=Penicillium malachiteum TaxID=1324776 RepID=UPI002548FE3C|nr:uncharacterized protein N7483_009143 [Penicillium malachiteum]KAJ5721209.1 hypothetical protein N7483_009143 [Penicillium malachiteum]
MKRFWDCAEDATSKRQKASNQARLTSRHIGNYTVAWFCAIHEELAAARDMLDEVHEPLPNIPQDDPNHYTLDSIKGRDIVITCLPHDRCGTCNASLDAANMKRSFPRIRVNLMVGVGGGVPGKADIRLGDIVVGTRVMQYDLGKTVGHGKSERTAIPRTYDHLIETTLTSLRSKHDHRLFVMNYEHASKGSSCDECDQSKLVKRPDRTPEHTLKIHYGTVASGNQVIKHAMTRDKLAEELDVICFEMEAAGPMEYFPCLPIRGICDYSDSHKTKEWQRCAALNAAGYAREFIEELRLTREQVIAISNPDADQSALQERRKQLLDALRFNQIDFRRLTIKKHHAKTCQWFLSHPDYKMWLDPAWLKGNNGFIWISGKPGAGKSTIMKFAYLEMKRSTLKSEGRVVTASFFFNARGEYLERSTVGIYRSLLLQLLEGYPDLQIVLDDPEVVPPCQNDCPSLITLKDLFWDSMNVTNKQEIPFRICFSSRHYPYIVPRYGKRLILEVQSRHSKDLETYIKSRLRISDPALIEELHLTLLSKAACVFMWVVLVVDIMNKEYQRGGLAFRKRIAEIPSDLGELFKDILTRDADNMEQPLLCIQWILFARWPLRPVEFHIAVWFGLSLRNLVDNQIPVIPSSETESEGLKVFVIGSSKGLAEITKSETPTVQFIHESVRDFLVKDNGLYRVWLELESGWQSAAHEDLKQCCHFYLNRPWVLQFSCNLISESKSESRSKQRADASNKYPFLVYASRHILDHSDAAAEIRPQQDFLSHFPLSRRIKMNNLFHKFKNREYSNGSLLMKQDPQVHSPVLNEKYEYPLFAALASCNKNTVAAILNAPPNSLQHRKDFGACKGETPLTWAARNGRLGILKLLLEAGLDVSQKDRRGFTALSQALENCHESVARLLIENGANLDHNLESGMTPLAGASRNGYLALVRLLIDNRAMINGDHGGTALFQALENGREEVAAFLIENGANINAENLFGVSPLSVASWTGHKHIVRLLIDKGADVNAMNLWKITPILHASEKGYDAVVRLLIERGADVNAIDWSRSTPISHASEKVDEALVRSLIDSGAKVNTIDRFGYTPFLKASNNSHSAVVKRLIENGADVNAIDPFDELQFPKPL